MPTYIVRSLIHYSFLFVLSFLLTYCLSDSFYSCCQSRFAFSISWHIDSYEKCGAAFASMLSLAFIVCGYLLAAAMWPFGEHAINNFLKITERIGTTWTLQVTARPKFRWMRERLFSRRLWAGRTPQWGYAGLRCHVGRTAQNTAPSFKIKGSVCVQQFPYQVQLEINTANPTSSSVCGGTLLSTAYVVTAAHCFYGFNITSVVIYAGSVAISGADSTAQSSLPVCCASSFSQTGT